MLFIIWFRSWTAVISCTKTWYKGTWFSVKWGHRTKADLTVPSPSPVAPLWSYLELDPLNLLCKSKESLHRLPAEDSCWSKWTRLKWVIVIMEDVNLGGRILKHHGWTRSLPTFSHISRSEMKLPVLLAMKNWYLTASNQGRYEISYLLSKMVLRFNPSNYFFSNKCKWKCSIEGGGGMTEQDWTNLLKSGISCQR